MYGHGMICWYGSWDDDDDGDGSGVGVSALPGGQIVLSA